MRIAKAFGVALAAIVLVALALFFFARPAGAHNFFSQQCCSDRDCAAAEFGTITWTPTGWSVQRTGEIVPFADPRIQYVPTEELQQFYICLLPAATRVRCIYVPESAG